MRQLYKYNPVWPTPTFNSMFLLYEYKSSITLFVFHFILHQLYGKWHLCWEHLLICTSHAIFRINLNLRIATTIQVQSLMTRSNLQLCVLTIRIQIFYHTFCVSFYIPSITLHHLLKSEILKSCTYTNKLIRGWNSCTCNLEPNHICNLEVRT